MTGSLVDVSVPIPVAARPRRFWEFLKAILSRPMGGFALVCVTLIILVAIFAPLVAPYDPDTMDIFARLKGPTWQHLMGTDQIGRDVLSRIIYGTRTAMTVAGTSLGLAAAAGLFLGLIAGYGPRWLDAILLLCFDSVMSLPVIIFALAIVTLLGPSITTLIVIIVTFTTPGYARVVRSQTLVLKRTEYVLAARAMAASVPRILVLHIMPNLLGPLLVLISMDVTTVITIESGLSFIGLGVQPPTPSWGSILNDGYSFIRQDFDLVVAGGLPIVFATLGFNFLGETIRDVLDPRLRGGRG
ncbi:ABC transporter permease [Acidisoma cladoniae]|uniref:ABC transporter permease n=1 Tax=Acidisoma cladoniae TaxID=3040935 RepID=UPI00254BD3E0|nr:ABC transporter permease [Acidisoma sp. PAMC 29798]